MSGGSQRGMAMLITLAVISVLFAVVLQVSRGARTAALASAAVRDRWRLSQTAWGGIHGAMALLIKDRQDSETDTLQEDWADGAMLEKLGRELAGDGETLSIAIEDEMGRIKVNALLRHPDPHSEDPRQMLLLERLVAVLREWNPALAEVEPQGVVQSVKDWLDSGDGEAITGLNGAESGYYAALDPPYACRNGPLTALSELLLIKGVSPELYAGSAEGLPGLAQTLSVHGAKKGGGGNRPAVDGRVNINTAPPAVLAALLPEEQRDLAAEIVAYREARDDEGFLHELTGSAWYREIPGGSELQIAPQLVATSSDLFRITASARGAEAQAAATAVVQREKDGKSGRWRCRVLEWRTE